MSQTHVFELCEAFRVNIDKEWRVENEPYVRHQWTSVFQENIEAVNNKVIKVPVIGQQVNICISSAYNILKTMWVS